MLRRPKPLNSPKSIPLGMGNANYSGTANSSYEQSKLASRGFSAVAGIAALVGSTYSAMGQDAQPVAYNDTNLAQYGVPNVDGMKPYQTKFLDKTPAIPGQETKFDIFRAGDGLVGMYSINDKIYAAVLDLDGKPPLEYGFIDKTGDGKFEAASPKDKFYAPTWATR